MFLQKQMSMANHISGIAYLIYIVEHNVRNTELVQPSRMHALEIMKYSFEMYIICIFHASWSNLMQVSSYIA